MTGVTPAWMLDPVWKEQMSLMRDALNQPIKIGDQILYPKQERGGVNIVMTRGIVMGFGERFYGRKTIPIVKVKLSGKHPRGKEVLGIEHFDRMIVIPATEAADEEIEARTVGEWLSKISVLRLGKLAGKIGEVMDAVNTDELLYEDHGLASKSLSRTYRDFLVAAREAGWK